MKIKDILRKIWNFIKAFGYIIVFIIIWDSDLPRTYVWLYVWALIMYEVWLMRDWFKQVYYFGQIFGWQMIKRWEAKKNGKSGRIAKKEIISSSKGKS